MMMTTTDAKGQHTTQTGAAGATKKTRPLAGFLIAGASLAALFGLAVLKGRVKDSETSREARN